MSHLSLCSVPELFPLFCSVPELVSPFCSVPELFAPFCSVPELDVKKCSVPELFLKNNTLSQSFLIGCTVPVLSLLLRDDVPALACRTLKGTREGGAPGLPTGSRYFDVAIGLGC